MRNLNALLVMKLSSEETLDAFVTQQSALLQITEKKIRSKGDEIAPGESRAFFLTAPKKNNISKFAQLGDVLTGTLVVDKWPGAQGGRHSRGNKPSKKSPALKSSNCSRENMG